MYTDTPVQPCAWLHICICVLMHAYRLCTGRCVNEQNHVLICMQMRAHTPYVQISTYGCGCADELVQNCGYVCRCVHAGVCAAVYANKHLQMWTHRCMCSESVQKCVCTGVCTGVCVCVRTPMCVQVCTCKYVGTDVCTDVCTHMSTHSRGLH